MKKKESNYATAKQKQKINLEKKIIREEERKQRNYRQKTMNKNINSKYLPVNS